MPTLRDKFAMAALQGMLADSVLDGAIDSFVVGHINTLTQC